MELEPGLETHLALIEDEERSRGSSPEQARRAARARFGNRDAYRERALEIMSMWLESIWTETVFAARRLARAPAFTMTAVITLALAIAANVSIFAVIDRVILNPLPYPESGQLVELDHGAERLNVPNGFGLATGLYFHYAERSRAIESLAIYRSDDATLSGDGDPERIQVGRTTSSLASVLGVQPTLGRWFSADDDVPGAAPVAVLSHGLWNRRYAADPAVLGRLVVLNGTPTQVIGILPSSFGFLDARAIAFRTAGNDIWIPARITRSMGFGTFGWAGVARLRDGVAVAEARKELTALVPDLIQAFPGDPYALGNVEANLIVIIRTLHDALVGGVTRALWTLLAAAGLVLLVACTNIANLFLVRTDVRLQEISIRRALGAGRAGIVRYFMAESVLLATAGGLAGISLAAAAVGLLVRFGPSTLPRLTEIRLSGAAVAYTLVLSAIAAVAFGLIAISRGQGRLTSTPGTSRGNTITRSRHRTRRLLMGGQVATALLLLVAAGLMVRSFQRLRALDPGFNPTAALTFSIGLPDREYVNRDAAVTAHRAILDRLSTLPGVTAVSASTCLPLTGGCYGNTVVMRGRERPEGTLPPPALFRAIADGYFEAMGMRLVQGRGINRDDIDRRRPVIVIDETLAERFFPGENPIGQHIASNRAPERPDQPPDLTWLEIIGVVVKTPVFGLVDSNPRPQFYMPMSIAGGPHVPYSALIGPDISVMSYVVRSTIAPTTLLGPVRRAVDTVDPNLAIAEVRTLQDTLEPVIGTDGVHDGLARHRGGGGAGAWHGRRIWDHVVHRHSADQ